ncbi:NADH dehydrogenase [ubiquinone] 1 beta subcomplex subunit 7 isoform X2 [Phaenicophaeus curvirostris]|uniref:NADH dehydrogenase [ubiquinone] 1 beta subcomplex subunit 7 isoform X2 n=1 Tax=Phaenicophaeus curvirostris TaxID=33595 RepID=UPI0037F0EF7C
MGAHLARRYLRDPEVEPDPLRLPSFEPELGLGPRRPREVTVTAEALAGARVPLEQRDGVRVSLCHCPHVPSRGDGDGGGAGGGAGAPGAEGRGPCVPVSLSPCPQQR